MIKTVTNKKDYIKKCDVEDFDISKHYYDKKVQLFGKEVYLNSDLYYQKSVRHLQHLMDFLIYFQKKLYQ